GGELRRRAGAFPNRPRRVLVAPAHLLPVRLELALDACLRRIVRLQQQRRADSEDGSHGERGKEIHCVLTRHLSLRSGSAGPGWAPPKSQDWFQSRRAEISFSPRDSVRRLRSPVPAPPPGSRES